MARATNSVKHTHQYYRLNGLWHCSGIDGCTHYMPKNMPIPVGRFSVCWGCRKEFLLTPVNMLDEKPKCDTCSEGLDRLEDYLDNELELINRPIVLNPLAEIKRRAEARKKEKELQEKDEVEVIEPTNDE